MPEPAPRRCALSWCASVDNVRLFVTGLRCRAHTPAALAGEIEPDEIAALSRRNWAASVAAAKAGEAA